MDMSHAATCLAMLQKVEDISTFPATRNATFCCRCRLQNWGVTLEIFLATWVLRDKLQEKLPHVTWPLMAFSRLPGSNNSVTLIKKANA